MQYAQAYPERNIAGLEIRAKFIEPARAKIKDAGLANAYVLQANAATALPELFTPRSLSRVIIMFPDPWYKPRHLKRRVVNKNFLRELGKYLQPGAELHIATDRPALAADMYADLQAAPGYQNKYTEYAPENFPGLVTDNERYQLERGYPVYRLVFSFG